MAFFQSSDQLYDCTGALFERLLLERPEASESVSQARLLIRLRCRQPAAEIVINGRRRPATVSFGANRIRPELDIALEGDTLHQILLGELTVPKALSTKLLKVRGPAWKTLTLVDLFKESQKLYPSVLREQGLFTK